MENLFWYYKQIMNVFIRAICAMNVFIGEMKNIRLESWDGKLHLSPLENIFTIALINIHYLSMLLQQYIAGQSHASAQITLPNFLG